MRGSKRPQEELFHFFSIGERVPQELPDQGAQPLVLVSVLTALAPLTQAVHPCVL